MHLLKKIFGSIIIGLFLLILALQQDLHFKAYVGHQFQEMFQECFNAHIECTVESINLFNLSMNLNNVVVTPIGHENWRWSAQKFTIHCSPLHLIKDRSITLDIAFDGYAGRSFIIDNVPAIKEHIDALLFGPPLIFPLIIRSVSMQSSTMHCIDEAHTINGTLRWHSNTQKKGSSYAVKADLIDSQMHNTRDKNHYLQNFQGQLTAQIDEAGNLEASSLCAECSFKMPYLTGDKIMHGTCSFNNGKGSASVKNGALKCALDQVEVRGANGAYTIMVRGNAHQEASVAGTVFQAQLPFLTTINYKDATITTTTDFVGHGAVHDNVLHAQGQVRTDGYRMHGACKVSLDDCVCDVACDANLQSCDGQMKINLDKSVACGDWIIQPHDMHAQFKRDSDGKITGSSSCMILDKHHDRTLKFLTHYSLRDAMLTCSGTLNGDRYHGSIACTPQPSLVHFEMDNGQHSGISLKRTSSNTTDVSGTLDCAFVRKWATFFGLKDIQAEGLCSINIQQHDNPRMQLALQQGNIRIPYTYIVVRDVKAGIECDIKNNRIIVSDLLCALPKGTLWSDRATVAFNKDFQLSSAHIPVSWDSCLFRVDKDLFAILSGHCLITQQSDENPRIKAHCFIDHAQLKENIFSHALIQQLVKNVTTPFNESAHGFDITSDISLHTLNPIKVRTPFLETDAKVQVSMQGSLKNPHISGLIALQSGKLQFPYRPLHITQGKIQFDPQQPFDPRIECVAKNSIKNHNISLTVTGTVTDPHIALSSSPPLPEEQIISLMLVGSKDDSLNIMMPALVMHSIGPLVFGNAHSKEGLSRYYTGILKPFKHIHLIPTFTDQTGRGGLRGAVEIDVNDRLHALIQRNFSLTEDTRFELEYLLSDEIGVKLFRDERRDMGGEVEMRWRF